ncbi:MAG: YciI family protein [Acidobacteria bacterium]|nr:YciI family protein [Acidobacteriota bacterium]
MKYMLMIYMEENAMSDSERAACYVKSTDLAQRLSTDGKFIAASPLQPVATATSVRVREGQRLITDGPFAETREHLGGFYLIDVANLDEAINVAECIPGAAVGTVEIRPVIELEGVPPAQFA